jgi:hypothetical protein
MVTGSMRLSVTLVAADFLQSVTLHADHVSGPAADGHHWMPSPVLSPDVLGVVGSCQAVSHANYRAKELSRPGSVVALVRPITNR